MEVAKQTLRMGGIAQLGEQQTEVLKVPRSIRGFPTY